jgi:hypothetical protein
LYEALALVGHLLGFLHFPGATQAVGELHHLFLVNDDAEAPT